MFYRISASDATAIAGKKPLLQTTCRHFDSPGTLRKPSASTLCMLLRLLFSGAPLGAETVGLRACTSASYRGSGRQSSLCPASWVPAWTSNSKDTGNSSSSSAAMGTSPVAFTSFPLIFAEVVAGIWLVCRVMKEMWPLPLMGPEQPISIGIGTGF